MKGVIGSLAASVALIAIAMLALGAGTAQAIDIHSFKAEPSFTQAGGHADLKVEYAGETRWNPDVPGQCKCNDPRDVTVSLPTGFIGNPHATPQCKAADFARNTCPADSQIGTLGALVAIAPGFALNFLGEPLYNLVPRNNQAGLLGSVFVPGLFNVAFYIQLGARTDSDYGLNSAALGIERQFSVETFTVKLWGVPAADSHTPERCTSNEFCQTVASNSPEIPFLINPGVCSADLTSRVTVVGYDNSVSTATAPWPKPTGCDQLTFNPSLSARPTTTAADSASGVDIDLTVPQLFSPSFPSPSEIKAATLKLPEGFSINPNAADGKLSCSDAQANFGTTEEAHCPEFSKVGIDTIDSPALPAPISGGIYLGTPLPGDRYRLILAADGFGTHVKLLGSATPDPQTGQLITRFEDLPQSPLTEFNLHFFGAERGILATPTQCGTYPVESTFTPWDDVLATQSATQFFEIETGPDGAPCPPSTREFHPRFSAASSANGAGTYSPFTVNLARNDGDQNLRGLTVTTPPGFTASLAGIPYCPDGDLAVAAMSSYSGFAQLQSPICPASQIGTVIVGGGAGSRPIYLGGKVYLAGPYKGAPLSLAIVTPAVSGPYDLGNVVIRTALNVNPVDAHVTAVSDQLPIIFEGIPLRLRSIQIRLDRPGFALSPTNCSRFDVRGLITGDQGAQSDMASHYQVANCRLLPYEPALSLRLTGGLNRRGHPAIHAILKSKAGEANSKEISVSMPKNELLDNSHIGTVCTRVDFAADSCPSKSLIGNAKIITPILDQPLSGPVYLRSSAHRLPDIALKMKGQVDIEATARIDSVRGGLRATFSTVPDVPFSKVELNLAGGKKGLLQNTKSLCGARQMAKVRMAGQNGAAMNGKSKLLVACGKEQKRSRSHSR
jgi:hypothetical protein